MFDFLFGTVVGHVTTWLQFYFSLDGFIEELYVAWISSRVSG